MITVNAHAKINWTLDVLNRRLDGYHEIASIMQTLALHDVVMVTRIPTGIAVRVTGPESGGVPADERNLVWRAAQALGAYGVEIAIEKNIPAQAGLGGGSSDAAAALTAVNRLMGLGRTQSELLPLARALGADVSFFLIGGTASVEGIGERVTPLPPHPDQDIVLVKPSVGVATGTAYAALDALANRQSASATMRWPHCPPSNDFEAVIYDTYPEIAAARDALIQAGAETTLLCGSGATVMGIGQDVEAIASRIRAANVGRVWVTRTINAAGAPS